MIKVDENKGKYPSCIACHSTEGKRTFKITIGDKNNNSTVIELCEDCLLELRGQIYTAL